MWAGASLFFVFGVLESLVLFLKRPEPWSGELLSRLLWSPTLQGMVGLAVGVVVGLAAALLLPYRTRRVTPDSERSSVWSLALPAVLGLFWVYAANRLYPGSSRETTALLLDGASVAAALILAAILWKRTVVAGASFRQRAVITFVLGAFLWLPFYMMAGAPSLEYTRDSMVPRVEARASEGSPNLILIMTDTVRSDCVSCYGPTEFPTPAFDLLASEGTLFEQAVTPEPLTRPAVCTLFTGVYPRTHGVDSNAKALGQEFLTLAEVFRRRGYRTAAFTAASVLSGAYGTAQGFDHYSEPGEPWWYLRSDSAMRRLYVSLTSWQNWWVEIPAGEVNRRALAWMESNRDEPFFMFVHYFDAHAPYRPPAEYDLAVREGLGNVQPPYEDEQARFAPDFEMPENYLRQQWLRYRGEITYVDACLSEFLDRIRELGLDDGTVVALVADHGESFGHHAWFSHGNRLYDSQVHVPMILRGPGVPAGARVTDQVRLVDVYPTLLSLLGSATPDSAQGVDLRDRIEAAGARGEGTATVAQGDLPAFCQTDIDDTRPYSSRVSFGLRLPPWKLIVSPDLNLTELYDLTDDPGETSNVAAERAGVARGLASELEEWQAGIEALELEPVEMTPEALESLRALGYLQ